MKNGATLRSTASFGPALVELRESALHSESHAGKAAQEERAADEGVGCGQVMPPDDGVEDDGHDERDEHRREGAH